MNTPVIFIVGPTAVGKSKAAILLAQKIGAEIISCDSMQIYDQINILSSKPDAGELAKVKHHLIGTIDIGEEYDVARFEKEASESIEGVLSRNKTPLIAGGTGFYMTILLDGIFEDDKKNPQLRNALWRPTRSPKVLYEKLKALDEEAAVKIHPNDTRRIIRALEVCLNYQEKFSELKKKRSGIASKYNIKIFGLNMKRDLLYKRIDERVDKMIDHGAIEEVKNLAMKDLSKTASACLGFRQIRDFLLGAYSKDKAIELFKRDSRHYAKRQLTWFRRDKRINWIDATDLSTEEVVGEISGQLS